MKTLLITSGLLVSLLGTSGCIATRKYVGRTVTTAVEPVEKRVGVVETKNTDQDKQLVATNTKIEEVDRDLSRTKERLNDTDAKASTAGVAASAADAKATAAASAAGAADSKAQRGVDGNMMTAKNLDGFKDAYKMDKLKLLKTDTVLFGVNRRSLSDEAKAQLDAVGKSLGGVGRYVIELQGFTDKTGPASYNESLSQERAVAVARYLANEHKVPLHNISMLGSGEAAGDQKTSAEREQNRKVDIRVFVPEI